MSRLPDKIKKNHLIFLELWPFENDSHQKYSNIRICHFNTTDIKSISFIND